MQHVEVVKEVIATRKVQSKSIAQRALSNFAWSVLSEAIGRGMFVFANIYLARILGVSSFGLFAFAQAITFYFWLAVDLGINMYGIREIAKNKEEADQIINPLLTLRITSGIVIFALYLIALALFDLPMLSKVTFAGCGLYLVTYSLYADWALKGLEKFKYVAFGNLTSSTIFIISIFVAIRASNDVAIAAIMWSLSYLFGGITLFFLLQKKTGFKYKPVFNLKIWRFHLRESIFFTISGGFMLLYQYLPTLTLGIFFSDYEVGLFSAPYRIITIIGSAGFLIPMAFYPIFSELADDKNQFKRTHKYFQVIMLAIGIPIAVIGAIFSQEIISLLFGDQYQSSVLVFKILIYIVPLYFLRFTYGSVLLAAGFQRLHNYANLVGAMSVGILGLILIPTLGVVGGALSLVLSEALIVCSMALIFYTRFNQGQGDTVAKL